MNAPVRAQVIPDAEESHPGLGEESRFDEAIIAYNKKQTQKSLKILDELLLGAPQNKEYLQMKALALKDVGDPKKSLDVYLKLYAVSSDSEKGPYAFELGTLYTQLKNYQKAKTYFQKALDLNFNKTASNFYLGLSAFQLGNYGEAEKGFLEASEVDLPPFTVMARYYLGICYFKMGNGPQGVQQLVEVRHLTKGENQDEVSKSLGAASDKMLTPFSSGQWFGNLVLQSQFDSNVQQLPTGASNSTGGNNAATMKMNFSGGGGYMTAPLNTVQWVAGYRASYNYNFNSSTKGYEYFTNDLTVYANYHALERTSAGLKVESTFAFQNALSDPTNLQSGYQYQKYNFTVGVGPYLHHQINRQWRLEAEVGARSQTFYSDPELTGADYTGRVSVRSDLGQKFFNPGASVVFENNRAVSDEFFYTSEGVGVMNTMSLPGSVSLMESVDFLASKYSRSSTGRSDKNYVFRASGVKLLSPKFSVLADVSYLINSSTVSNVYSYNEFLTSLGVGYTF